MQKQSSGKSALAYLIPTEARRHAGTPIVDGCSQKYRLVD
jgi:hypothetical protein